MPKQLTTSHKSVMILVLGALSLKADTAGTSPSRPAPQRAAPTPPTQLQLQTWRQNLALAPRGEGTYFRASYPDLTWSTPTPTPVSSPSSTPTPTPKPCGAAAPTPTPPRQYSAKVEVVTVAAEGSFGSVKGVSGEHDCERRSSFGLQLNTNHFPTSTMGCAMPCRGWQQFLFGNPGPDVTNPKKTTGATMQYWLLGYHPTRTNPCPSGWTRNADMGGSCFKDGPFIEIPSQTIDNLANLALVGTTVGNVVAVIAFVGTDAYAVQDVNNPFISDLQLHWRVSEFNVVGHGDGSTATFPPGASVVVHTSVYTLASPIPTPSATPINFTAEHNNFTQFTLSSSQPVKGLWPAVVFTEALPDVTPPPNPTTVSAAPARKHK